jgi:hypothetical protein
LIGEQKTPQRSPITAPKVITHQCTSIGWFRFAILNIVIRTMAVTKFTEIADLPLEWRNMVLNDNGFFHVEFVLLRAAATA